MIKLFASGAPVRMLESLATGTTWRPTTDRPRLKRAHEQGYVSLPAQMAHGTAVALFRACCRVWGDCVASLCLVAILGCMCSGHCVSLAQRNVKLDVICPVFYNINSEASKLM
jgi:hypothetical protein